MFIATYPLDIALRTERNVRRALGYKHAAPTEQKNERLFQTIGGGAASNTT
jgi:hypothetical protein